MSFLSCQDQTNPQISRQQQSDDQRGTASAAAPPGRAQKRRETKPPEHGDAVHAGQQARNKQRPDSQRYIRLEEKRKELCKPHALGDDIQRHQQDKHRNDLQLCFPFGNDLIARLLNAQAKAGHIRPFRIIAHNGLLLLPGNVHAQHAGRRFERLSYGLLAMRAEHPPNMEGDGFCCLPVQCDATFSNRGSH